jgi:hypothetical protein
LHNLELSAGEWLENEFPIPLAWVRSDRFSNTFFPLFGVYTFDQKPQEEKDFCQTRKRANIQVAAREKKSRKNKVSIELR